VTILSISENSKINLTEHHMLQHNINKKEFQLEI